MTNRFLISVAAAALLAGTGFANAQGAGGAASQGGSTAQQHSAPSSGGAATQHQDSGMKAGQSEKSDRMGAGKQAEELKGGKAGKDMKAEGREGKEKSTVGQAPDKSGATTQREDKMGRDKGGTVGQSPDKGGAATKANEGKMGREDKSGTTTTQQREDKSGTSTTTTQDRMGGQKGAQGTQTQGSQTTTGMAPAAPPPEKRSQITTAIKSETSIQETNVNVNVAVGTRLPETVRFVPLPPRIVEIYPEWRGYEVVRIHGRYVIVKPDTREIVYIIEG